MTKKDLFRIIIKLFGLYSIIQTLFTAVPQSFGFVMMDDNVFNIAYLVGTILFLILLFTFLIYKVDVIIRILKLDEGFDNDEVKIANFNAQGLFQIALILLGGVLFFQNIATFLGHLATFIRSSFDGRVMVDYRNISLQMNWGISFVNLLVGYLLVKNSKQLSLFFNKKANDNEQ